MDFHTSGLKIQSPTRRASNPSRSACGATLALSRAATVTPRGYLRSSSSSTFPEARRSSDLRTAESWRECLRGATSTKLPPATVVAGLGIRSTKRSWSAAAIGRSRYSWTQPSSPGRISPPSRTITRAETSAVPAWSRSCDPWRTGCGEEGRTRSFASARRVAVTAPTAASTSPRDSSLFSTPVRLAATRLPGPAFSTLSLWRWSPRMRTGRVPGTISISSPTLIDPSTRVPVTTVPNPLMRKTRSMGRRGRPRSGRGSAWSRSASRAVTSSGMPSPVTAETSTMRAPSSDVPRSTLTTSCLTSSSQSGSTRSRLVSTTRPRFTSRRSSTSTCSRVCGITPSSAATTRSAASRPCAPASMLRMKRAWPGTSTIPTSRPLGSVRCANPRSIVMPRRFSSARRSGSMPVSAVINVDLPWSMWPAVPTTKLIYVVTKRRLRRRRGASRPRPAGPSERRGSNGLSRCAR